MEGNMEPKEFYDYISKKKEEIRTMNIPETEKEKLYALAEETIKVYEESLRREPETMQNISQKGDNLAKLIKVSEENAFLAEKISAEVKETNSALIETKKRIDEQIAAQKKIVANINNMTARILSKQIISNNPEIKS